MPVHPLAFEGTEERLHGGIVIAILFPAHADMYPSLSKQGLIDPAGILAAATRMVQQARCWMPAHQCHLQGLLDQLGIPISRHRPANHQAREEVEDDRQIEPALGGPHPCDIRYPFGVRSRCTEIPVQEVGRTGSLC